jgi:hypothetical protein
MLFRFFEYFALGALSFSLLAESSGAMRNLEEANLLDAQRFDNEEGEPCQGSNIICVGDQLGLCVEGNIVAQDCDDEQSCRVLPLNGREGTFVSCVSDEEADQRLGKASEVLSAVDIPSANSSALQVQNPGAVKNQTTSPTISQSVVGKQLNATAAVVSGHSGNANLANNCNLVPVKSNVTFNESKTQNSTKNETAEATKTNTTVASQIAMPTAKPGVSSNIARVEKDSNVATAADFRAKNVEDANRLDKARSAITQGSECKEGETVCAGDLVGLCANGRIQTQACVAGTRCRVLPLVNKPGTSVACTTDEDATRRLGAA